MATKFSTAEFLQIVTARGANEKLRRNPDPLPTARTTVIQNWPNERAKLLLRVIQGLSGKDEKFSSSDVEMLMGSTLSVAWALSEAGLNGMYRQEDWEKGLREISEGVKKLG